MTPEQVIELVSAMPGAVAHTVGEADGAPEIAWGDTFFYYDPQDDPAQRLHPFATIVTKDYTGFDESSRLDRPGVFRVNIAVGRQRYAELLGHLPAEHAAHADDYDDAALDELIPHPVYGGQGWVCVVSPGEATDALVSTLLAQARDAAAARLERRQSPS